MNGHDTGLPIEHFVQALTSQLDRAQSALALKARAGLPLTFAVKDVSLDLRAHVEMSGSVVRLRPAEPGETDASVLHLSLTTITKPMIEENSVELSAKADEPSLKEALGPDITDDERRRLEWAGVYNLSQLQALERQAGPDAIGRVAELPVDRLRRALSLAAAPRILRVTPVAPPGSGGNGRPAAEPPLLHVHGVNLIGEREPIVRIRGEQVPVLRAADNELLVKPAATELAGTLSVQTRPGSVAEIELEGAPT